MIGDLPTAVHLDHRNITGRQHVFGLAGLALGEHRGMLNQPQLVVRGIFVARVGESLHVAPDRFIIRQSKAPQRSAYLESASHGDMVGQSAIMTWLAIGEVLVDGIQLFLGFRFNNRGDRNKIAASCWEQTNRLVRPELAWRQNDCRLRPTQNHHCSGPSP